MQGQIYFLFQFDLSSVSAVNSEEEALIPHQSRDVVSDEHMDLSKTRIEEPSVSVET